MSEYSDNGSRPAGPIYRINSNRSAGRGLLTLATRRARLSRSCLLAFSTSPARGMARTGQRASAAVFVAPSPRGITHCETGREFAALRSLARRVQNILKTGGRRRLRNITKTGAPPFYNIGNPIFATMPWRCRTPNGDRRTSVSLWARIRSARHPRLACRPDRLRWWSKARPTWLRRLHAAGNGRTY